MGTVQVGQQQTGGDKYASAAEGQKTKLHTLLQGEKKEVKWP